MKKRLLKLIKYFMVTFLALCLLLVAIMALYVLKAPDLQPWHTFVPQEMTVAEMDGASWQQYIEQEIRIFEDVRREVVEKVPPNKQIPINRYFKGAVVYSPNFKEDWNRSYLLVPENPKGAVVLLHGLTDTPYSLRHVGKLYYQEGFAVVGLRTPGHGTVPGALTKTTWQEWMAGTRLAVREAKRLAPEGGPLHVVGFSKGGLLALRYALDAIEDENLDRPDKLVLISPMIGITRLSKFAEIMAKPSILPGFEKAAWISIIPEFNPFKYNSFPANGVRQARLLINSTQQQIARLHDNGKISKLPPILTFQSIVDYTVSTPALINNLYAQLPDNDSELVLFDINRSTAFMPLVRPVFINMLTKMLPQLPQPYKITIIGNSSTGNFNAVEKKFAPGSNNFEIRDLGLPYPQDVFSLSHIALSFPENDSLYGSKPDEENKDEFGLNLGVIANAQGERGVLEINTSLFFRISSNPLFPYLMERIREAIHTQNETRTEKAMKGIVGSKSGVSQDEYDAIMQESEYKNEPF